MENQNNETLIRPDRLFEVSWEVCNKVGGIHTVVATKAQTMVEALGNRYITIGPDIHRENDNTEFEEDTGLLAEWKQMVYSEGIRIRIGRWNVNGRPITILVDFSSFFNKKDDILKALWESYKVDSISGQWDYIEPVLFGYAAGKVIESYCNMFCTPNEMPVAHFHEWMTSSGGLYLRQHAPYTATVFSTHATVVGRSIAGNGIPLYRQLPDLNADDLARQFNIVAKHSLEKIAAANHDCFCTVSDITARECRYLLGREPDEVTPNGFEDDFVWQGAMFDRKRAEARRLLISVAEACLGHTFDREPLIVGTSGRYEFHNKGIDVFLESLKRLASERQEREILAYIMVPAGNNGPRKELAAHLADPSVPVGTASLPYVTHHLTSPEWDPIVRSVEGSSLTEAESRVKLIFVPSYLDGQDGIFNVDYYELLVGMDATVFASYYEPWGYTPLESVAFSVPTITTSLAGFGLWVADHLPQTQGVTVIRRTDDNDAEVIDEIARAIEGYAAMDAERYEAARHSACETAQTALWQNLVVYYWQAYDKALRAAGGRSKRTVYDGGAHTEQVNFVKQQLVSSRPTWTRLIVEVSLPERLRPLEILSKNLWWSWASGAREMFEYIDAPLWEKCNRNPIAFLDQLNVRRLQELERDDAFLARMDAVYADFQRYMSGKERRQSPRIAYFSMEYGLHSSLKIYSGGLGILAGDYLKEASDKNVPMVGVGLLYRYGYFTQRLSANGAQEAGYEAQDFNKLPITPVRDDMGNWCSVRISFPGRYVTARIWKCDVGRTELYLLDTDHDLNLVEDRSITHYLYGGDLENRFRQEILLGVGGIRALDKLGIQSDIFHCNEGHAAFIGIERINRLIERHKLSFSEALEVVRSSSLFTTHTPVPAGHDAFPESMLRQYMSHYPDRLGITWEQFINLGKTKPNDASEKFSMSVLASNMSQEINGVSWLHGQVSKEILGGIWPGYFHDELHIGYVTNGVHFPTWTASSMRRMYAEYFPEGFSGEQYDIEAWQKAREIPDERFWQTRMEQKAKLIKNIRHYYLAPEQSNMTSPQGMVKIIESFDRDALTIGFARRFATYKRANLLFTDLARLSAIVNNPERPVRFVFAGKAHPNDIPGQELIKRIVEVSAMPEFTGKIMFLANYDMDIARRMVQGVDVWLNTPTRPQEASGTSGMKAAMNGVMQFSVLDGWWVEGYRKGAGWALPMKRTYEDPSYQDELDAALLYRTIEEEIVPLYYDRGEDGIPHGWVAAMKSCVADIAANFTTNRMLTDYQERYYGKLWARTLEMRKDDYDMARRIAAWKRRVSAAWDKVRIVSVQQFDVGREAIMVNTPYRIEAVVDVDGLDAQDIGVELIIADQIEPDSQVRILDRMDLNVTETDGSLVRYAVNSIPTFPGSFDVAIRVYPKNDLLPHRMDFALVKWA